MSRFGEVVFLWKKFLINYNDRRIFHQTMKEELLSEDELLALREERCINLFRHAYSNIPYYRKKYQDAGIEIDDIQSYDDFGRLPVLEKQEVREHAREMIACSDSLSLLKRGGTGGSTGEPLLFYKSVRTGMYGVGAWKRMNIPFNANWAIIGRNPPSKQKRRMDNIFFYPCQRIYLDAAKMTREDMRNFAESLLNLSNVAIRGYVGGICEFAEYAYANGYKFDNVIAVWTSSAPLADYQRKRLAMIFQAPVFTQYGCCEVGWLSEECVKQNGMHIHQNIRDVDVVDDHGVRVSQEHFGRIVITDLLEFRFPLIRYALGDIGRLLTRKCDCGCNLPLMDYVRGRVTECLFFADGTKIAGDYLTTIFDDVPMAVKSYQVRQAKDQSVRLLVCPNYEHPDCMGEIEHVGEVLKAKLPTSVAFSLDIVGNITHDRGKNRFIIHE